MRGPPVVGLAGEAGNSAFRLVPYASIRCCSRIGKPQITSIQITTISRSVWPGSGWPNWLANAASTVAKIAKPTVERARTMPQAATTQLVRMIGASIRCSSHHGQ
ncbi:hypothetical protein ACWKSP_16215 [Micromonosporaceae bacterium Da 78-11]